MYFGYCTAGGRFRFGLCLVVVDREEVYREEVYPAGPSCRACFDRAGHGHGYYGRVAVGHAGSFPFHDHFCQKVDDLFYRAGFGREGHTQFEKRVGNFTYI